jgi:UTP:GlnB (protein PII) uridylyltransferase
VATYAALMVLAAGLAWEQSIREPDIQTDVASATALNTQNSLNQLEAQTVSDLETTNPEVNAGLRRDLKIVNDFIAVCQKAVREEPQDETARQYLYGAYQQKSELLAAAMAHSRIGD